MELKDPRVRKAFVSHVLALQEPNKQKVSSDFLFGLLDLVLPSAETVAKMPNPNFPVSLRAAALLLDCDLYDFSRLVVGRKERQFQDSKFVQGEDFIYASLSHKTTELFMTCRCFLLAGMKLRKGKGSILREYFFLMDKAYRDIMGENIFKRLQYEQPEVTKNKEDFPQYVSYGKEPGNYSTVLTYKNKKFLYHGITDDLNTRFQNHRSTKAGKFEQPKWKANPSPNFKEACRDRYYNLTHQVAIPVGLHGSPSLSIYSEEDWKKTDKFCDDVQEEADEKWVRQNGVSRVDGKLRVLNTPEDYPIKQKTSRKNRHSGASGMVALYSNDSDPIIVQENPDIITSASHALSEETFAEQSIEETFEEALKNVPKNKARHIAVKLLASIDNRKT